MLKVTERELDQASQIAQRHHFGPEGQDRLDFWRKPLDSPFRRCFKERSSLDPALIQVNTAERLIYRTSESTDAKLAQEQVVLCDALHKNLEPLLIIKDVAKLIFS